MKKLYNLLFSLALLALVSTGCKKNMPVTQLNSPGAITGFTATTATLTLSSANDSQSVVTFNWSQPSFGYSAIVTYTLMIDQPSDTAGAKGWANAIKMTLASGTVQQAFLGTDFNHVMNQLGLPDAVPSPVVVRLKADVNQSTGAASTVPSLTSDVPMTVTAYKVILIYPKLYVAGDFLVPNWTQINQPGWILTSVLSNSTYEGYVNFVNAGNSFKLCAEADWNGTNYGWGGTATTISGASSAGNCYSAGPNYSRVVADVSGGTIAYTPVKWVIAGDFNNWSVTANPMTFNTTTNQWTATGVNLVAGKQFKFVGDPSYNSCFGADAKGNLVFGNGNVGNFTSANSGAYTVTLDLSQGVGNYNYSVK